MTRLYERHVKVELTKTEIEYLITHFQDTLRADIDVLSGECNPDSNQAQFDGLLSELTIGAGIYFKILGAKP